MLNSFKVARKIDVETGEALETIVNLHLPSYRSWTSTDSAQFPHVAGKIKLSERLVVDQVEGEVYAVSRN